MFMSTYFIQEIDRLYDIMMYTGKMCGFRSVKKKDMYVVEVVMDF